MSFSGLRDIFPAEIRESSFVSFSNADSRIAHPDHQSSMRLIRRLKFRFERNTAFVRKFDGIVEQIQKHLPLLYQPV